MINSNNIHVKAKTLQSYLDLRLEENSFLGTKSFKRERTQKMDDFEKDLDILIVDESSMVSNELLGFIIENFYRNKLKTVLFIGDPYQLTPVDDGENSIDALPQQYELTQMLRQAQNSYIKIIANELKDCIKNKEYVPFSHIFNTQKYPKLKIFNNQKDFLEDFTAQENWHKKNRAVAYKNKQVNTHNKLLRYKYWKEQNIEATNSIIKGDLLIFDEAYDKGAITNSEEVRVDSAIKEYDNYKNISYWKCTDNIGRTFKVVDFDNMQTYNDYLQNIANEANKISYKQEKERSKKWVHYFASKNEYAMVKYIFAATIHKSQGSTYENTYIDISSITSLAQRGEQDTAYRLLYVAVTRASKDIRILM